VSGWGGVGWGAWRAGALLPDCCWGVVRAEPSVLGAVGAAAWAGVALSRCACLAHRQRQVALKQCRTIITPACLPARWRPSPCQSPRPGQPLPPLCPPHLARLPASGQRHPGRLALDGLRVAPAPGTPPCRRRSKRLPWCHARCSAGGRPCPAAPGRAVHDAQRHLQGLVRPLLGPVQAEPQPVGRQQRSVLLLRGASHAALGPEAHRARAPAAAGGGRALLMAMQRARLPAVCWRCSAAARTK
jgi:hypothetical protein